jgi:hypothetical protein
MTIEEILKAFDDLANNSDKMSVEDYWKEHKRLTELEKELKRNPQKK